MPMLSVNHVKKTYTTRLGGAKVDALTGVSFEVEPGEFVAIMGESGSGKTTLLNIMAALTRPSGGEVRVDGEDLASIGESALSAFRRDNLGFVFQDFNLLDNFSLRDNILLPLVLKGMDYREMEVRLASLALSLGIGDILNKFPYEVSGGQKQRAAIARALITGPKLLLADEPTGALDSRAAGSLLKLLGAVNQTGQTIVMVTHSLRAASHAGRVLFLADGQLFHQLYKADQTDDQFYQKIADTLTLLATGGDNRA